MVSVVISKWNNYTEEVSFYDLVYIFIESLSFVATVCSIRPQRRLNEPSRRLQYGAAIVVVRERRTQTVTKARCAKQFQNTVV